MISFRRRKEPDELGINFLAIEELAIAVKGGGNVKYSV